MAANHSKAKIYYVRKYANGRQHFVSIGEHAVAGLTERKARDKAQEIIISIRQGDNPTAERTRIKNTPTLSEYAEQAGIISDNFNPARGIKHYKIEARQRFLSHDELTKLGKALSEAEEDSSENLYAITAIRLLIYTGARLNEMLTLRWEWVDLERGYLHHR